MAPEEVVPTVATTQAGRRPAALSRRTASSSLSGIMANPPSVANGTEVPASVAGDLDALFDARMGLLRGVDRERLPGAGLVGLETRGPLAGGEQGAEGRRRSGVLDDPGEPLRQADHLAQPVEHGLFELRRRGRGLPDHALGAQAGRQEFRRGPRPGCCWPGNRRTSPGAASG